MCDGHKEENVCQNILKNEIAIRNLRGKDNSLGVKFCFHSKESNPGAMVTG